MQPTHTHNISNIIPNALISHLLIRSCRCCCQFKNSVQVPTNLCIIGCVQRFECLRCDVKYHYSPRVEFHNLDSAARHSWRFIIQISTSTHAITFT